MQDKRFEDSKKEIRSVLLTYHESVTLEEFLKTYRSLLGQKLPSRSLGFSTDVAFLQSMPDVVSVCTDAYGKIHLTGLADEKSEHIQKLVSKQRKPPNNKSNRRPNRKQPNHSSPNTSFNNREVQPFLPGPLKAEIVQLMASYQNGISLTAFALAYRRRFNKYLPLLRGLDTLEGMIKLIPELEVKSEGNEKKICHRNFRSHNQHIVTYENGRNSSEVKDKKEALGENNSFNIHKSGISDDILQSFQQIVQKCPEGILDIHFPPLYEKITRRTFDLHSLGYNSLAELVDALPHIFKRIINPEDNRTWVILPANTTIKDEKSPLTNHNKQSHLKSREDIPADAASPAVQYLEPIILEYIDLTQYVPVFVSAIANPSLFWFQLQTDESIKKFEMLENDMKEFYNSYADISYKMKENDIAIGAACVILCPEDRNWYRAVIKSIPSIDRVNVLYVDYGSRENIPRSNLYYVRRKYHDHPAYAFKAQLADLKPAHNESRWTIQAQRRFIELCGCAILMAYLKPIDKDTYSVNLCDTSGDTDIYLNETLINEGFAEIRLEDQFSVHCNGFQNKSKENAFTTDSEGEQSSGSNQSVSLSDKNVFSRPGALPVNRALSFSPEPQYNGTKENSFSYGNEKSSKRYIKLVQLCDSTKFYIINLENKLYMTCGDLSKLLWTDKDSDFLIERLKYKEVNAPFLKLSRYDYAELFKQCIWYNIPEFEKLKSDNSSLIICPIEWAFNILNIFGHPSVCLRVSIQNEKKSFDPLDSFWKEFCYQKFHNVDDTEKDFEQKISKLCLYDLKTKNEALKINRLKLLRVQSDSANKEIKRVERFQNIIERRMKEIETLCHQYSRLSS